MIKSSASASSNLAIVIGNYEFLLLGKAEDRYWYVYISSTNINDSKDTTRFWVYPSNSELGLWRLSANWENIKYKGSFVSLEERQTRGQGDFFYYDYVQQTCIFIELQIFINKHFDSLKKFSSASVTALTPSKPYNPSHVISRANNEKMFHTIDNRDRQIHLSPFIILQQRLECGETETITPRKRTPSEAIKEFSDRLRVEYTLLYDNVEVIAPYDKTFQKTIQITGNIMKFPLKNKTNGDIVLLYACIVKLESLSSSSVFRRSRENIDRITSKEYHIMPFFLTTADSSINCFGLYTKYIPCGAFICKLFDYSDGFHRDNGGYKQCTLEEYENNHCTSTYSYIGDRYDNLFPFNEWIEKTNKWVRKKGVRSANSYKRRATRKNGSF